MQNSFDKECFENMDRSIKMDINEANYKVVNMVDDSLCLSQ